MTAVAFLDPSPCFVAAESSAMGSVIDDVRGECGLVIQGVDWILSKIGIHVVDWVFGRLAGDFEGADEVRLDLASLGTALRAVGDNYDAMRDATDLTWTGSDARAAKHSLRRLAETHATQGEACALISTQVGHVMEAVKEGITFIASVVGMIVDEICTVPVAKILKWIITGAETIKRWIRLFDECITLITKLEHLVPKLCEVAHTLNQMMLAVKVAVTAVAVGAHATTGSKSDDTADAGF